jgi:hypothetical protein
MERGIYEKDISFLTLVSLIGSEGYGECDYMYYVKDEEMGVEGVKYLGNEENVEEMLNLFRHLKVLNIKVVKAVEPGPADQVPASSV